MKMNNLIIDIIKTHSLKSTLTLNELKIGASKGQAMFGEIQDMLVEPSSIAGLPGISLPCAFDRSGLPIGLQIMAPQKREDIVYQIAKIFEDNTDYHLKNPKL